MATALGDRPWRDDVGSGWLLKDRTGGTIAALGVTMTGHAQAANFDYYIFPLGKWMR
jgi:hypothetical protein